MSQEFERIYTINLGKVLLSPINRRSTRAINMIREFAIKHTHNDVIKIHEDLNKYIWKNGIRNPPRKIKVKMSNTDSGNILVTQYVTDSILGNATDSKTIDKTIDKTK